MSTNVIRIGKSHNKRSSKCIELSLGDGTLLSQSAVLPKLYLNSKI